MVHHVELWISWLWRSPANRTGKNRPIFPTSGTMDLITRLADTLCFPKPSPFPNRTTYQYRSRSAAEGGSRSYALSYWEGVWVPFAHSYLTIYAGDTLTVVSENYPPGYSLVINHRTNKTGLVPREYVGTAMTVNPDGSAITATADHTIHDHYSMSLPGDALEMRTGDTIRVILGVDGRWRWGRNERTGRFGFFPSEKVNAKLCLIAHEEGKRPKHD